MVNVGIRYKCKIYTIHGAYKGQVILLESENCLLVSLGYDDVTVTSLKFTPRDDLGCHCSKWSLDTKYSQIQESKLELQLLIWVMACHVVFPNSTMGRTTEWLPWFSRVTKNVHFSGNTPLAKSPKALFNQMWCLFILEVGIIGGLLNKQLICASAWEEEAACAFVWRQGMQTKMHYVNTTWPIGSQEQIKMSDALRGGCQIEQLKESLHLHMRNKVYCQTKAHTCKQNHRWLCSECAFCIPHYSTHGGFSPFFSQDWSHLPRCWMVRASGLLVGF